MGVLVIGMHRSGTSALSSLLEGLGLDAGSPSGLMASDAGNPDGYYEQRSFVELNDEILTAYGGRWDSPPIFAPGWSTDLRAEGYVTRVRELLASEFTNDRYVLKDPRISILLPLWRQALLDRTCAVVIVRDPSEVAWSLTLRDSLPPLTGLALWSSYNRTLLHDLSGLPVHICSYTELLETPATVIGDIVASLQAWGQAPEEVDIEAAVARVKPDLRRNTRPTSELDLVSPPIEVTALLKLMIDQRGRHDIYDVDARLEPGWWENPLLDERRLILQRTSETVGEFVKINDELLKDNRALREQSDELRTELSVVVSELQRARRFAPSSYWNRLRRLFHH